VIYPLVFLVVIRLWSVSHVRGFVTPADFVRARFDSPTMALLVAITGIVATMPYIALQLVGIEAILKAMGVEGELPLIVAFVILALYTYNSGLRAPALIAFVKDILIYLTIIVAVIVIRRGSVAGSRSSGPPRRSSPPPAPAASCWARPRS
jgi:SSS family solute:Na+ symporter